MKSSRRSTAASPAGQENGSHDSHGSRASAGRDAEACVLDRQLPERVLITGGAGFIGTNVTAHLVGEGCDVTVLDNLSRPEIRMAPWRPGDQRYYVSDTRRLRDCIGWQSNVGVHEGLARLYQWMHRRERQLAPAM